MKHQVVTIEISNFFQASHFYHMDLHTTMYVFMCYNVLYVYLLLYCKNYTVNAGVPRKHHGCHSVSS